MPINKKSSPSISSNTGFQMLSAIRNAKSRAEGRVLAVMHEFEGKLTRAVGLIKKIGKKRSRPGSVAPGATRRRATPSE